MLKRIYKYVNIQKNYLDQEVEKKQIISEKNNESIDISDMDNDIEIDDEITDDEEDHVEETNEDANIGKESEKYTLEESERQEFNEN